MLVNMLYGRGISRTTGHGIASMKQVEIFSAESVFIAHLEIRC